MSPSYTSYLTLPTVPKDGDMYGKGESELKNIIQAYVINKYCWTD